MNRSCALALQGYIAPLSRLRSPHPPRSSSFTMLPTSRTSSWPRSPRAWHQRAGGDSAAAVPATPETEAARPEMRQIYGRPELLIDRSTHYCPGCGHGVVHRLLAEVLGDLGVAGRTIAVAPVGCAVFAYDYLAVDWVEAPHGRAPAVATGVSRVRPDAFVLTYQGDGDLAAIGTAEIIHAAARGRTHHGHLREQRHLRHDRRPDGTDHVARPAYDLVAGGS